MGNSFSANYDYKELFEVSSPASLSHYFYPGASQIGGHDGMLVEVYPDEYAAWQGTFAFGKVIPNGLSGVFAMPNPQQICVVSRGSGYLVSVINPTSWECIDAIPVIGVYPVLAQGIVVFASFTNLVAYGLEGVKWRTERLTWDGMKITELTDRFIKGEFWDLRNESTAEFIVDLATGSHEGGASGF